MYLEWMQKLIYRYASNLIIQNYARYAWNTYWYSCKNIFIDMIATTVNKYSTSNIIKYAKKPHFNKIIIFFQKDESFSI